ncbi:MAG: L,D-transpeptidase family protein [Solirubrobacterales bacterium]
MLRKRMPLIAGISAALLVVLAVAAYGYDTSRDDLIAEGVHVAGVDVGGMRADPAAARLRALLGPALERPVRVAVAGNRFKLTAKRSHLAADIDGMVDAALETSRDGGLPARVWRGMTGREVNTELEARVTYSGVAVKRFVRRVKRAVNRAPQDADVSFHTASLPAIHSRTGLRVDARRLRASVEGALDSIGGARSVRGRVRVVQPKVTTADLAGKYPRVVTIDRANFTLRLFKNLKLAKTYRIAVGQIGLETPAGVYHVQNKAVDPAWHVPNSDWAGDLAGKVIPGGVPENPLKSRWLGIYDGAGIHGTDAISSLGTAASHGCIRMAVPDVQELYEEVPVQAPVYIQ